MASEKLFWDQLEALQESWINGNRKDVITTLTRSRPSELVRFAYLLRKSRGNDDAAILINLLDREIE